MPEETIDCLQTDGRCGRNPAPASSAGPVGLGEVTRGVSSGEEIKDNAWYCSVT